MLQNIPNDKILDVVRQGPTFPAKVAKQLGMGGDTVLVGAILSTLISSGEVKVSTIKIGGSPLYYLPEQESRLEEFIDHLNEKDRRTFKLLKDKKILQDDLQDPLTRVSLRAIKDFAKHFDISIQGHKIMFWRFYSESIDDAESSAKKVAKLPEIEQPKETKIESKEESKSVSIHKPEPETTTRTEIIEDSLIDKPEVQAVLEENISHKSEHVEHASEHEQKHAHVKHEHHEVHRSEHHDSASKSRIHHQKEAKAPKEHKPKTSSYDFFEIVKNHILSSGLDMISKEKIKKTEYDMVLKNHDTNEYIYCKAKDKSSVSEGDLAPAMIFAQSKKMPCLFISTGTLTKKAESMMGKELAGLKFEQILVNIQHTQQVN